MCSSKSDEFELVKYNLKIYNNYLKQCIRTAKKDFYYNELANIKTTFERRGIH